MKILEPFFGNNREALVRNLDELKKERDNLGLAIGQVTLQMRGGDDSEGTAKEYTRLKDRLHQLVSQIFDAESAIRAFDAQEAKEKAEKAAAAAEAQRKTINTLLDQRHENARKIDEAIDALAQVVRAGRVIHQSLWELNPPSSVPFPSGLPHDYLLRITEFRLRWQPGMPFAPFHNFEDTKVAKHLTDSEGKGA